MIKQNQAFLNRINALLDYTLVVFAYMAASHIRLVLMGGRPDNMALSTRMLRLSAVCALALILLLMLGGFYNTQRTRQLRWKLSVLFVTVSVSVLGISALLYVFRLEEFSRGVLLLFYLMTLALLGGKYIVMRLLFNRMRANGYNIKHEILIGSGQLAGQYSSDVAAAPELGLHIDMCVSPAEMDKVVAALARPDIDEAVIALEAEEYHYITDLISLCEKNGVKYMVVPFYNNIMPAHPIIETVGSCKLIDMRANRLENIGWALLKRLFDVAASALGLVGLSPLLLFIAMGVRLSSPGPVLFRQVRVGYRRRKFQMLKFRSMRVNDRADTAWSTVQDDRRTKFGAFLRKTSLDELPQLWNVLCGDMSLVGPRPELPHFVEKFREEIPLYMVKHQVKPGITGWAQVNGYRGDTDITKRIELDLWYIDHWSVWLDILILFRTLFGGMKNNEE